MRFKNRFVAGAAIVTLASGGALVAVAGPASAATPNGGCWVYSPHTPADIEDTTLDSSTSTSLAAWADPTASPAGAADYTITTSGNNVVGQSRDFELTFNKGPKNGGPAASGTAYYFFSVNGTNLPVVSKAFSVGGAATIPGDTITGSYTITAAGSQSVKLRKVYYDIPTYTVRVACNGQTSGTAGVNPATTPIDTNIASSSFSAIGPTAAISGVSNQVVTTHARKGDVISFDLTHFTTPGTATASLCDTSGANCDVTTGSVTVAGDGTGSGTLTVQSSPTAGSRALKVSIGSDVSLTPITILGNPTFSTNVSGGGAGTVVSFTGAGWDPNQTVSIGGYKAGPPYPPGATSDTAVVVTANASGAISGTFTVNDTLTHDLGGSRMHDPLATPTPVSIFASTPFTFSGDTCTAKVGVAATGNCALVQTMNLTVTAGNLTTSKASGNIVMPGFTLDGTAHVVSGALKQVTVKDYRGGALGWSLTGKFSGLSGPATITSDKLSWTPTCAADAVNNDDTVTTGSTGAFTTSSTAMPVCSVATTALGTDGASGGDTLVDAALSLSLGANQKAGAYVGTITLTLS